MEETIKTPESEKIDSAETTTEEKVEVKEEVLSDFIPQEEGDKKTQETVPLSVYLSLKDDMKELKKSIKEASDSSKNRVTVNGVSELAQKYPDVSVDFINDLLSTATIQAEQNALSKVTPILEQQKIKEQRDLFERKFEEIFQKALKDNPDLPENVDKNLIKSLIKTPEYRSKKISEILVSIYGSQMKGKSSSENETVISAGDIETISDFSKITPSQKEFIMNDEKSRKKYFDWLDKQI